MRSSLLFFLFSLLLSCQPEEENPSFQISGTIENPVMESVTLSGGDVLEKDHLENGQFHLAVNAKEAAYFTLWHDRKRVSLYLRPGDELQFNVDAADWPGSLSFEGKGAIESTFLQEQDRRKAALYAVRGSFQDMTKLGEGDFRRQLDQIYEELFEALQYFQDTHSRKEKQFAELEALRLELERATRLLKYPEAHAYFSARPANTPGAGYYDFLNNVDWDEPQVLKLSIFDDFLPAFLDYHAADQISGNLSVSKWLDRRLELIGNQISDPAVRDYAYLMTSAKAMEMDGIHLDPALINQAGQSIKSEAMRTELERQYAKWAPLAAGQPAPDFSYKDLHGKPVSLDDLRGRYLYVDIWATWCAPCLQELPFLEAYQEEYENSDRLLFLSISIDQNPEQWRRFITKNNLKGIQLLADKGWSSQVCLDYQISELPRFLIIDPGGRLVDADAPRPSESALQRMLEELI